MVTSFLCDDCTPEGTKVSLAPLLSFEAGPPRHCHGKNDRTIRGVMGGFRCSCACNQSPTNGSGCAS